VVATGQTQGPVTTSSRPAAVEKTFAGIEPRPFRHPPATDDAPQTSCVCRDRHVKGLVLRAFDGESPAVDQQLEDIRAEPKLHAHLRARARPRIEGRLQCDQQCVGAQRSCAGSARLPQRARE
jgi:hypothetical protein